MMEGYRNPHVKHLLCNVTAQRMVYLGGCHFCASFVVFWGFSFFLSTGEVAFLETNSVSYGDLWCLEQN